MMYGTFFGMPLNLQKLSWGGRNPEQRCISEPEMKIVFATRFASVKNRKRYQKRTKFY